MARAPEKQRVTAPLWCDLTEGLNGRHLHALRVGAQRDVLALSTAEPLQIAGGRSRRIAQFRVHHWRNGSSREFDLPPSKQMFYHAQKLGDHYLCVAARCAPDERNAHIFDARGEALHSWHAGDAIADVQVAPGDLVWISYFDQGALSGIEPSGQGLACFNAQGERVFGFADDVSTHSAELDMIWDCYALNVASKRDTWLCYYGGFPLVHLRDFAVKEIFPPPPEMIGSHAFAVCDWRRLFAGGYHFKNQIFWRDESSGRQVEIEMTDEAGDALNWNHACGRGADLFLCDEARVRMLSLTEIGF